MVYKFMKKLISWNVNGIRACAGKGFMDFFNSIDADIFLYTGVQDAGGTAHT